MYLKGFIKQFVCLLLVPLLLAWGTTNAVAEQMPVPKLSKRVTDLTNTLAPDQIETLASKLDALEKSKGSQLAVLMLPSTGEETIEQFSIRVVDEWKLGRQGTADGVLLIIAKDDKKVRIEVGRGLEGALPDITASRIIREFIRPAFKQGDFFGGINAGIDKIAGVIAGETLPPPKPTAGHSNSFDGDLNLFGLSPVVWLLIFVGGIALYYFIGPNTGRGGLGLGSAAAAALGGAPLILALLMGLGMVLILSLLTSRIFWDIAGAILQNSMRGGYHSGGYSGGSSSGSSNDSFSGGGGDFGGGGASGDW
jgi:uncharacterized protein